MSDRVIGAVLIAATVSLGIWVVVVALFLLASVVPWQLPVVIFPFAFVAALLVDLATEPKEPEEPDENG